MATKTTLSTPAFDTAWNGTDAFINTQSITVPSGTTHLAVRLVNSSSTMPTLEYNGSALTSIGTANDTNLRACSIYYLANPSIGTFDLVTNSAGVQRTIQMVIDVVSDSSGVGDSDISGGSAANRSLTLTTVSGDLVLDVLNCPVTASVGADQTADLLNTNNTSASNETATGTSTVMSWTHTSDFSSQAAIVFTDGGSALPSIRKTGSATFDKPAGIGTITGVTLDGAVITLDSQDATTFTVTDSDGSITTSGVYDLVATGDTVETISVQVNVYGVAPSNNPLQKDGVALVSLTNVEVRVSVGVTLAGSQLFYSGTATTDTSGNIGNIDLSSTAAADTDPVLLSIRTADGDSIIAEETVGLI